MECTCLIDTALQAGNIHQSLFQGSSDKKLITELQRILFELGFKKELNWDQYQADGSYGKSTAAAVRAFAKKNNAKSDGSFVSNKLAKLIMQRHDFLPSMYVLWSIHTSDLRKRIYISKASRIGVIAVQTLLNELGYGKELKFSKFGADGLYGNFTRTAVIKFAKDNGIESDGDLLTRPLVNLMLRHINKYYGSSWSELSKNNLPDEKSPLVLYQGSRFQGKPCRADTRFVPMLDKINDYAQQAEVYVIVTSSFRTSTNVKGAIVKPATYSNHLAGHAIDMNLKYGNNQWANSKMMVKYPDVPAAVKKFLKSIIDDPDLRWGGQFNSTDPVHIDDWLNKDRTKWKRRYNKMQKAVQLGE